MHRHNIDLFFFNIPFRYQTGGVPCKGQSRQIVDFMLDSVKLSQYFIENRLWF
jgi:hypothetical protein